MARVVLENLSRTFSSGREETIHAVQNFSLEISEKELLVVVGPSGSGKTTLLRLIAGLEAPDGGSIHIDGVLANDIPARSRDVAMVFQSHALYPHMTVFENMAFGLKLRKVPRPEILARVEATSRLLGIAELLGRKPSELSGGQAQRAALGRALVRRPKILLLDEPLSNLDGSHRRHLREEIKRLRQQTDAVMIYVTHDQTEALRLADRLAVMRDGRLEQVGTPDEIRARPASPFVADFFSEANT